MLGGFPQALERRKAEEPEKAKEKAKEKEEYRHDVALFTVSQEASAL